MADTPRKDHWASLLESIGLSTPSTAATPAEPVAEVPAAPVAPKLVVNEPTEVADSAPVAPAAEAPKPAAKKPAKTSGHWGKLAGMLGLSVAQQPEPEPEPEPIPPPPPAPVAKVEQIREVERMAPVVDDLPPDLFAPPARAAGDSRPARAERDDRGRGNRDRGDRDRGRSDSRREQGGNRGEPRRERERSGETRPAEARSDEPARSARGEDSGRRPPRETPRDVPPPRRGFGDGLVEDWPPESHPEPVSEADDFDDFVPAPRESVDAPAADDRLGFDRPSDEGEGGEHRRRRRRRRRGGRRDEAEATSPEPLHAPHSEDLDFAPAPEEFVDDEFPPEPVAEDDDVVVEEHSGRTGHLEDNEDRGPRRRRRRRRGSRGPREEGAEGPRSAPPVRSAVREDVLADDSDLEDDFDAPPRTRPEPARSAAVSRGRPQREVRRPHSEDDEVDESLHAELHGTGDDEGEEGHTHKKIPTWQDTVGFLIDGNMNARSERPEHRGGGRGGRRPPNRR